MPNIFEITDKKGRKVRLTKERWTHIRTEHPNIENPEEIITALQNPDKIINDEREEVDYFFKYFKHKRWKSKYLKVVVRYINNEGSILSAHFVRNVR